MRTWRWGAAAGGLVAVLAFGLASCGDDDDDGAAAPPQVDADPLRLEIQAATVPDARRSSHRPLPCPRPAGAPINLEAEMATTTAFPRTTGPRFTLAMLDDQRRLPLVLRGRRGNRPTYTYRRPEARRRRPGPRRRRRRSPRRTSGTSAAASTSTRSRRRRSRPASTGRRRTPSGAGSPRSTGADTDAAGGAFNFVPSGSDAVQKLETVDRRGAATAATGQLTAHGSRRATQLCLTCHSPQTGDPETDRTVDFKVMIHKIHAGEILPSVEQGNPYYHRRQPPDGPRLLRARVPVARPRRPALHRVPQRRGREQLEDEADPHGLHLVPRQREVHGGRGARILARSPPPRPRRSGSPGTACTRAGRSRCRTRATSRAARAATGRERRTRWTGTTTATEAGRRRAR